MRLDVYFHFEQPPGMSEVLSQLRQMMSTLNGIAKGVTTMSAELEALTTEVQEIGTVVDSAIALIQGLAQQINDLKDDPAALAALAASLDAKAGELAAAVAATSPMP